MDWVDHHLSQPIEASRRRLNTQGALGTGRQRADFLSTCRILAILEGSKIYDSRERGIVMESFTAPRNGLPAPDKIKIIEATDIVSAQTLELDTQIVNVIEAQTGSFISQGVRYLRFSGVAFPYRVQVPPQTAEWGILFTVADPDIAFIESWNPLIRGVHYDYDVLSVNGIPVEPRSVGGELTFQMVFSNPTNQRGLPPSMGSRVSPLGRPLPLAYLSGGG